jgi:hypothetical protein
MEMKLFWAAAATVSDARVHLPHQALNEIRARDPQRAKQGINAKARKFASAACASKTFQLEEFTA